MWAKVDDGWWAHPKVMGLPLSARGLWVSALSWSCHQRNPVVPSAFLALVSASDDDARALVSAGLWVEAGGGWEIHEWSHYQELSVSEKRAEAGAKGGRISKRQATDKQSDFASKANEQAGPIPSHPIPSRPIPSLGKPSSSSTTESGWADEATEAERAQVSAVLDLVSDARLAAQQAKGRVASPAKWKQRTRANLDAELGSDALAAVRTWDEPAHVLADVLTGARDKRWLTARRSAS